MPANVLTYDFNQVIVSVGGIPIEGYGPDDSIKIEPSEDAYSVTKGVDGSVTRNRKRKSVTRFTLTLMASSPANATLQGFHTADLELNAGVVPVFVHDLQTGSTYFAEQAWVTRTPGRTIGEEIGAIEWLIDAANTTSAELGGVV